MTIDLDFPPPFDWAFIDLVPLKERDAQYPGFYLAGTRFNGSADKFRGAVVYYSLDNTNWNVLGTLNVEATIGVTTEAMDPDASGGSQWDTTTTIDVELRHGTLESKSADEVIAGENNIVIGDEIVGFQTATLQSGTTYRLSNLLRSRRGTDDTGHVTSERCVLLNNAVQFFRLETRDIGDTIYIEVVPAGGALGDYDSYSFTFAANNYWPWSALFNKGHVESRTDTSPPSSPAEGDKYLVPASATGDWSGEDGNIAVWSDRWIFLPPVQGLSLYVEDENQHITYEGVLWRSEAGHQTLTDAATVSWDAAGGISAQVTLGGNRTMESPQNPVPGKLHTLHVIQDGTGSRTLTWQSAYKFAGGSAPTLSTAAGARDVLVFACISVSLYLVTVQLNVS